MATWILYFNNGNVGTISGDDLENAFKASHYCRSDIDQISFIRQSYGRHHEYEWNADEKKWVRVIWFVSEWNTFNVPVSLHVRPFFSLEEARAYVERYNDSDKMPSLIE